MSVAPLVNMEEELKAASADLTSLGRVSHRLAMVDTSEKLQAVLDKLLPRLLQRIGDNHQRQLSVKDSQLKDVLSRIHMKLVEMLSHAMKRVRDDLSCQLNASGILSLLVVDSQETTGGEAASSANSSKLVAKDNCDSFSLNLSLTFLTLAIPRSTSSQLEEILPKLLLLHAAYEEKFEKELSADQQQESAPSTSSSPTKKQWHQMSHLVLRTLERIVILEEIAIKQQRQQQKQNSCTSNANKRIKPTIDEEKKERESSTEHSPLPMSGLDIARDMLIRDSSIAASTYDLLLDVLLYEAQAGNVPSAGLSSVGWERLKSGPSSIERDWAAEMAPLNRLTLLKTRLMEWIAPNRRFGLFLGNCSNPNCLVEDTESKWFRLGRSRTVALIVAASGDPMQNVADEAKQYLKQYFEAHRDADASFGKPEVFCLEMLSLSVGGINSSMVHNSDNTMDTASESLRGLGIRRANVSSQRRQVSESRFSAMIGATTEAFNELTDLDLVAIGKLSILSSDKMLSKLQNVMGLNNTRGKPFVAAAKQLNGLVARLGKLQTHDTTVRVLESRALSLATQVLLPISLAEVTASSSFVSESSVTVRDSIYGTISMLCRSSLAEKNFLCLMAAGNDKTTLLSTDLLQLLLKCIRNEVDRLRPRTLEALDALLSACRRAVSEQNNKESATNIPEDVNPWGKSDLQSTESGRKLLFATNQLIGLVLPLMWEAARKTQPKQSRVVAARWASDLIVEIDVVDGTHLLCFLAGDADVTAAAIAREGIGLEKEKTAEIAEFGKLSTVLLLNDGRIARPSYWEFTASGKVTAMKCLLRSLLDDFHGDEDGMRLLMESLSESLLSKDCASSKDLLDVCSEVLSVCLEMFPASRALIASSHLQLETNGLREKILASSSAKARRYLALAFGSLLRDISLVSASEWASVVSSSISIASELLKARPLKSTSEVYGAALLGGICVKILHVKASFLGFDALNGGSEILARLGEGLLHADDSIGNVSADGIFLGCSSEPGTPLHDRLAPGMISTLTNLSTGLKKFGNGECSSAPRVLKLIECAGAAAAFAASGSGNSISSSHARCRMSLLKLLGSDAFRNDEEIALATGEALASIASRNYSESTSEEAVAGWPVDIDEIFLEKSTPPTQVLYFLLRTAEKTNNNHQRRACAPALLAIVVKVLSLGADRRLREVIQDSVHVIQNCFLLLLNDSKSSQLSRESCCLGLVALEKLSGTADNKLTERLLRRFGQTTNFGGSAMQETAGQAQQRRSEENSDSLAHGIPVVDDSPSVDVGGAAGVSEASLGAYVEMASAAVLCGRPDILYSMLVLSVSHPVWSATNSRRDAYGPSALQGADFDKDGVKTALKPYLRRLLPRVLRACHDPNKQTREQMETLWVGITGGGEEARAAISANLRPTIDALVAETSSKLWRTRVGATSALAQVIIGRSWKDLGGGPAVLDDSNDLVLSKTSSDSTFAGVRLLRLWRCALRALDDVRTSVRESGEALARGVRSLTIRLCDPEQDNDVVKGENEDLQKHATAAAATSLRFLLKVGLNQQCPEAAGVCISTLIGIIDITSKPAVLEALLSDVLYALLIAMSNLEPSAFSYLTVRQDAGSNEFENLARLRLQASQSSPLAMAIRKCVDLVPMVTNLRYQDGIVGAIESAMRKSTGIATRSACADCIITLCHSAPQLFRASSSASSLLRCLYEGVFRERGGKVAQDKMNSAFGSLASLCDGADVRRIAISSSDRYKRAHGNNDDPSTRRAAALTLRSIAVKASNQLQDPAQIETWCKKILPIAFLGMKEQGSNNASLWEEVWQDASAFVSLDADENTIEERLLLNLAKEAVDAVEDVSWDRRVTGANALADLASRNILSPPPLHVEVDDTLARHYQTRMSKRAKASKIALSSLVRLVAKNRVWSGKGDAVKATVRVVVPWIEFSLDGAEKRSFDKTMTPISSCNSSTDLFYGDKYFVTGGELELPAKDDSSQGSLANAVNESHYSETSAVLVTGLCHLLLLQSFPVRESVQSITDDEVLPFRANVMQALEMLLKALPEGENYHLKRTVFCFCSPVLTKAFKVMSTKESPLIISKCIACFSASIWPGISFDDCKTEKLDGLDLLSMFLLHADFEKQPAWTVRVAATECSARIAQCATPSTLQRHKIILTLLEISTRALKDRKFWKVRHGGLLVLRATAVRGINRESIHRSGEQDLIFESVLPFKEKMQLLCKKSLQDTEPRVTALSTEILGVISTWP